MKQIPLAIGPDPLPTFDTFLTGANAAAWRTCVRWTCRPAPVYLWGPTGSGKSHLLRALVDAAPGRGRACRLVRRRRPARPGSCDAGWTLVVVDDCDAARCRSGSRPPSRCSCEAGEAGVQWAAAGRVPPVDLPLRDDLRTRLAWGHVFALQPLARTRPARALRREADRRGIFLSDEVMDYLLTRFARDLGTLMQLLDRLDDFALARKRAVTVPLLRQMLQEDAVEAGAHA